MGTGRQQAKGQQQWPEWSRKEREGVGGNWENERV